MRRLLMTQATRAAQQKVAFPTMTETSQGRQLADGSAKVLFAEWIKLDSGNKNKIWEQPIAVI
jgi:hypothetical protein